MNVRPAPFELIDSVVAATLGKRAANRARVVQVHLHRTRLVDEVRGSMCPADVPGLLRPDCASPPIETVFPEPGPEPAGSEPPRVALLEAAEPVLVETPNLDRPGDDLTARGASPTIAAKGEAPRSFRMRLAPLVAPPQRSAKIALPPLVDPMTKIVVRPAKPVPRNPSDVRREQIAAAIAYLQRRGILVSVKERDALIRKYRVSGKAESQLHEQVIEIAVSHGFEVSA